jgi:menaquinone-dependent protoporphyrinogen oxidase
MMSSAVLVAFATRYGSTREVADAIAATMRESGISVDVQPAKEVRSLDGYGAVVLGAPRINGVIYK